MNLGKVLVRGRAQIYLKCHDLLSGCLDRAGRNRATVMWKLGGDKMENPYYIKDSQ
jgi:hypothetical protein